MVVKDGCLRAPLLSNSYSLIRYFDSSFTSLSSTSAFYSTLSLSLEQWQMNQSTINQSLTHSEDKTTVWTLTMNDGVPPLASKAERRPLPSIGSCFDPSSWSVRKHTWTEIEEVDAMARSLLGLELANRNLHMWRAVKAKAERKHLSGRFDQTPALGPLINGHSPSLPRSSQHLLFTITFDRSL